MRPSESNVVLRCPSIIATPSCAGSRRNTRTWGPGHTSSPGPKQPSGDITGNLELPDQSLVKETLQTSQVHRTWDGSFSSYWKQGDTQEGTQRVHGEGHDGVMLMFGLYLLCLPCHFEMW